MLDRWGAGRSLAFALTLVAAGVPSALGAQQQAVQETAVQTVPDSVLQSYARALVEIKTLHIEIQEELAASTNKSDEAQARIREQLEEEVQAVLEAHGLTDEEYRSITWVVSSDQDHKDRLSAIVAELGGVAGEG